MIPRAPLEKLELPGIRGQEVSLTRQRSAGNPLIAVQALPWEKAQKSSPRAAFLSVHHLGRALIPKVIAPPAADP